MISSVALGLVLVPVALAIYAYIVYPVIVALVGRRRRIPEGDAGWPAGLPIVSVVIPAYNEETQIRGAIEAILSQDYPADRLQILILSDASIDRTDSIVASFASRGVELLRMPKRGGKTAAENASCPLLRGSIIVNTDASIRLYPATVRKLVLAMADPEVGVASGRDVSVPPSEGSNATEGGYVGYEMRLRALETRAGGIVGASGSGYAIRKSLHLIPVRDDLSRDFSAALTARRHGLRAVSVDDALCAVPRTGSLRREYKRKVRTICRGMETLATNRSLLDPIVYGWFAWKLLSHKVCRWLLPPAAVLGVVGLVILAPHHVWAAAIVAAAAMVLLVALIGWFWPEGRDMPGPISVAAFGVAANVAVLHAGWRFARGHEDHIWEPTRRAAVAAHG